MNKTDMAALVGKAQAGDRTAFEELYCEFEDKVYFFCKRNVGSEAAAKDVTSETFMAAFERIGTLREGESFVGWLYSIAYHKSMDHLKETGMTEQLDEEISDAALNEPVMLPEDYAVNAVIREQLKGVIDGLPTELRSAVIMYYYNEMSVAEVAKALGTNPNNAKQKLLKARKIIRKKVEKLIGSGAEFCAVPVGAMMLNSLSDSYAKAAVSGGMVKSMSLGAKIAIGGAIAAAAVAIPFAAGRIGSGGDARDKLTNLKAVNEELKTYSFTDTGNLHFECSPVRQELGKLYIIKTEPLSGFKDNAEREQAIERVADYAEKFCGQKIDKAKVVPDSESSVEYYEIDQGEDRLHLSVSANKTFSIASRSYFDLMLKNYKLGIEYKGTDPSTHIIFGSGSELGKTYTIDGKSVDVKSAAEFALSWIKDNFSDMFDPAEDGFEIADAIADKSSDGKYYSFHVRISPTVGGVRINENGFLDLDPMSNAPIHFIRPHYIDVEMTDEKTVISTVSMFRTVLTEKKEAGNIIPLSEAVNSVAEGLAPNLKYTVRDVRLKYCMHSTNKTNNEPNEYRPMWSFLIDVYDGNSFYSVVSKDLFVDAIDGTIYINDSKKMSCEISERK